MTAKEALDRIAILSEILVDVSKFHIMPNDGINEIRNLDIAEIYFLLREQIKELEELKRYPTADEVCEALSEWIKKNVEEALSSVRYDEKSFYYFNEYDYEENIVQKTFDENIAFGIHDLPPRLITLIGRFYEGLEAGE